MAISSALIVGPLLLIVFVEVWGVVLIARSPDEAVAEDVMVGFDTTVVVVTLFVVLFPWLPLWAELFETLELLLAPDNDKVECSIIVLKRLILNKTNHATLSSHFIYKLIQHIVLFYTFLHFWQVSNKNEVSKNITMIYSTKNQYHLSIILF